MERVGEKEKAIDLDSSSYRFSSVLELKKTKQNKTKQNKINQPKWRAFPQQGTNVAMPSNHIDEMARRRRKQKDDKVARYKEETDWRKCENTYSQVNKKEQENNILFE